MIDFFTNPSYTIEKMYTRVPRTAAILPKNLHRASSRWMAHILCVKKKKNVYACTEYKTAGG